MSEVFLDRLCSRFEIETEWLLVASADALTAIALHDRNERSFRLTGEMAVVRLHDSWARFCRRLIVMSAGGKPWTGSRLRLRLAPGIRKPGDVIPLLLATYKSPAHEPKWYDSAACIGAAKRLKIQNLSTVSGAIGSVPSPADELRRVRNFFVHRGREAAIQVRTCPSLSSVPRLDLESLAGGKVYPGTTRMEQWVNQLRLIAVAAIQ
jgi:hypothetical protein